MRLQQVVLAFGLAALAGCTSTSSTGVVAMGPDMYGMKVVSRNLAGAAEKGLTDATAFCNGMGRQTQLLRTQITTEDYQLVFRCMGNAPVVVAQPAAPVPSIAGMAIPNPNAPVLAGAAFTPPRTVADMNAARLATPGRAPIFPVNAPVLANPSVAPPPLPALGNTPVAPLLGRGSRLPATAALTPLAPPPVAGPTPLQPQFTPMAPLTSPAMPLAAPEPEPEAPRPGFFRRLFGAGEAPRSPAPAAGGMSPASTTPGSIFPLSSGPAPAAAPLPPLTSPLEPLRSPLGAGATPPPLALPAAASPVPPALEPVAAPPPRALPPVPLQPLPRLSTNVPGTLPPPSSTGGAAPTLPPSVSTEPPTGFWQTPRS